MVSKGYVVGGSYQAGLTLYMVGILGFFVVLVVRRTLMRFGEIGIVGDMDAGLTD